MSVRKAAPINPGLIYPIATGFGLFNTTSTTITAPVKRGFLLGATTHDSSAIQPSVPSLAGWYFQMIYFLGDAAAQTIAFWIAWPSPNLLGSASGTSFAVNVNSFTGAVFRQYDGSFKGELLDVIGSATNATSLAVVSPSSTQKNGPWVSLAGVCFQSGGVGINTGADSAMPDIGAVMGLCSVRLSAAVGKTLPASTTFSAGRSSRWHGAWLVMR